MVVLSTPVLDQLTFIKRERPTYFSGVPTIDLSKPDSKKLLVRACEEFGFFKVINHGIPLELIDRLEAQVVKFFSLPQHEKEKEGHANPFGYGNKRIGPNGDIGWIEYLLMQTNAKSISQTSSAISRENPEFFRSAVTDYISAMKKLVGEVLELLAEGLRIHPRNVFSKLLMDEESDSVFRVNHYPPCPDLQSLHRNLTGFGEHTDPQLISVLRSNNTSGLQISLRDGTWVSVPPDDSSFFINVGDSLQVLTNGRFKSVRHRVVANCMKSRVSMIYFGAPTLREKIAPLPLLMGEGEESLYREFSWSEYKIHSYKSRLTDNRLRWFEK